MQWDVVVTRIETQKGVIVVDADTRGEAEDKINKRPKQSVGDEQCLGTVKVDEYYAAYERS